MHTRDQLQRQTVRRLVFTQAVGAVGITIGVATASLLARDLSGSEMLAGMAQTAQVCGTALAAVLLARLMAVRGRRPGLVLGYLVGAAGSALAVLAGIVGSMTWLLIGAVLLGATSAANSASRYAATDLATDANRARSLSLVVWATTIGAVAGPNLTGPSAALARRLGIPVLTGPFLLGAIGMLLAAVVTAMVLRPDPLLAARELAEEPVLTGVRSGPSWPQALTAIRDRPVVLAAIAAMSGAHAAMVAVMVMTPLHMEHGGAHLEVIGLVISIHVLGMFAFSPLMGWAADRYGRGPVVIAGGLVLLVSTMLAGLSPAGDSVWITAGLFLLGLGWSAATVAASTVVADEVPLSVRADVQGVSDSAMSLSAALGGGVAGFVVALAGFDILALVAAVLALAVLAGGWYVLRHARVSTG